MSNSSSHPDGTKEWVDSLGNQVKNVDGEQK
jgi:hypothetical protein